MGDLFWNKVAAAVIGLVLMVMVIGVVGDIVFSEGGHGDEHASLSYPIDLEAVLGGTAGGAAVEEDVIDLGTLLAAADASAGERIFRRCVSCHNAAPGAGNLQGPNLWGVVGRDIGSYDGFSYSSVMAEYPGNWTYEELNGFLANPRGYLSGTAMAFAGIRGDEDRADLLAYLQTLGDTAVPFPAPAPVVTEVVEDATLENVFTEEGAEASAAAIESVADVDDQMDALDEAAAETPAEDDGN
ncbi:c-type cytochrome [Hyphobacterium sp.]|uniref:c-type cytochrome n=1 Tax=Hyphobacterium sp. TaxID=2004662 RepID=UPI003B52BAC2